MKKIMFNDRYGLTKAVLEGRKTMTRRIIPEKYYEYFNAWENPAIVVPLESIPDGMTIEEFAKAWSEHTGQMKIIPVKKEPKVELFDARLELVKNIASFKVGEVVAVAQSYNDSGWNPNTLQQTFIKEPTVFPDLDPISPLSGWIDLPLKYHKGWINKMFVYAGLMPHQIRITNIKVERLQDITRGDIEKEGIQWSHKAHRYYTCFNPITATYLWLKGSTPEEAFAALIDKVSGKGVWDSNPFVFVYEFELVK